MATMKKGPRIFDDLAKLASGAASTFAGFKEEVETIVRQQLERLLAEMNVTSREEFEAVRDMSAKARGQQESLERRVAQLEAKLGIKPPAKKPAAKKPAAKKPAARKPAARKPVAKNPAAKKPAPRKKTGK